MRLIKHIKASKLLSFGPDGLDIELQDLNVLIGPNGSGKSNFLEIFELLRSLPRSKEDSNNLNEVINRGGGFPEWSWKGELNHSNIFLETILEGKVYLKHGFDYSMFNDVVDEYIKQGVDGKSGRIIYSKDGLRKFSIWNDSTNNYEEGFNAIDDLSVLSQRLNYPELIRLVDAYEKIRLYREWSFGRNTIFRTPQRADLRNDRLESDFSNLGMFLSRLRKDPNTKRALIKALEDLYEGLADFEIVIEGGTVQIFFTEGDFSIPATRLSDGTLRYLCMLAILLDPTPPPLICIEEPELGLHPDLLPKIADLLVAASQRTQLIVTTHSDVLIDALSDTPEAVLICEKHDGQTHIKRLARADIVHWLEDYRLGQLWTRGEIGGTRW